MSIKKIALLATTSAFLMAGCSSSDSGSGSSSSNASSTNNSGGLPVEIIEGDILQNKTLTADKTWLLKGVVNVGDGAKQINSTADENSITRVTLTIEPGTNMVGDQDGTLIINRGSKLMAEGTEAEPITFSSQQDDDYDGLGEWGGVIVQGFAPQNAPGSNALCSDATGFCNVQGEGGSDVVKYYGGTDEADNSGVIKYVRIAEAGKVAGANNEVNGLTLQGVGYGTTVEYVQVHNNLDDGIEWFGGTVNAKYLVLTGNDDDDIDFDEGYVGNIQYALIIKSPTATAPQGSNDPRAIEANSGNDDSVKATTAVLSNITIIGSDITSGANDQPAVRLRGDLTTEIHNTVVSGYNGSCLRVDNGQDEVTDVTFNNILVGDCGTVGNFFKFSATESSSGTGAIPSPAGQATVTQKASNAALAFDSALAVTDSEASISSGTAPTAVGNSGFTFDSAATSYLGAVDPDTTNANRDWWSAWTLPGTVVAP